VVAREEAGLRFEPFATRMNVNLFGKGLARDTHEDGKVRRWDQLICELLGKPSLMELW